MLITGSRPMNSGINPYVSRSSGTTFLNTCRAAASSDRFALSSSAPNPTTFRAVRREMICSNPTNAPPQMNRMFAVFT